MNNLNSCLLEGTVLEAGYFKESNRKSLKLELFNNKTSTVIDVYTDGGDFMNNVFDNVEVGDAVRAVGGLRRIDGDVGLLVEHIDTKV